jgi:hypothetical protein
MLKGKTGVYFVVLHLKDNRGAVVSNNSCWLASSNDFRALNNMPATGIKARLTGASENNDGKQWTLELTNDSGQIAFFIRPQMMQDDEEVAPSFWSAGYFTLAPGESKNISVTVPGNLINKETGTIRVSGWNVTEQIITLNP